MASGEKKLLRFCSKHTWLPYVIVVYVRQPREPLLLGAAAPHQMQHRENVRQDS